MADFAPDGQPLTQDEYDYNFDALNHAGGSVYESETARRKRQRMDGRKEMSGNASAGASLASGASTLRVTRAVRRQRWKRWELKWRRHR